MLLRPNGEAWAAIADTLMEAVWYKVVASNHCPFCGKWDLEPCECFSSTKNNGKIKPECEGCSG